MIYQLIESWDDPGVDPYPEWGVSLDGSPNPEADQYIQCRSKDDAKRLIEHLDNLSARAERVEAELDAARPLLEAALGPCENRVTYAYRVNEAALAYRAKMEGKEKGQ